MPWLITWALVLEWPDSKEEILKYLHSSVGTCEGMVPSSVLCILGLIWPWAQVRARSPLKVLNWCLTWATLLKHGPKGVTPMTPRNTTKGFINRFSWRKSVRCRRGMESKKRPSTNLLCSRQAVPGYLVRWDGVEFWHQVDPILAPD